MSKRFVVCALLAAVAALAPVAARSDTRTGRQAASQTTVVVDQALVAQFVGAGDAERESLIAAHPDIIERAFREWLTTEGGRLRTTGDVPNAEQYLRAAIYIGEHHHLPGTVVTALNGLWQIAYGAGDRAKARQLLDDALALATTTNSLPGQQVSLANIAILLRRAGDLDGALAMQERALEMARRIGDPLPIARSLHNAGLVIQSQGNSAKALNYYVESLAVLTNANAPPKEMVATLIVIGTIYGGQSEYELAATYYQRAIDASGSEITVNVAGAYNNLGQTQLAMGHTTAARAAFERALPLAQQTRSLSVESTMIYNLGIIAEREHRPTDAETLHRRSLTIREQQGERMGVIESLTELSEFLTRQKRADEALVLLERAVGLSDESRLLDELWHAEMATGHALSALGRDADARVFYERAIQTVETIRALSSGSNAGRRAMFKMFAPSYGLAALNIRANRIFDALATIDRSRGRTLVDIVSTTSQPSKSLSEAPRAAEDRVTTALLNASAAVDEESRNAQPDRAKLARLQAELDGARLQRESFLAKLYAGDPALRLTRAATPDLTLAQLEGVLRPGTAIVTFVIDDTSWAYVATRGPRGVEVTAHALPTDTDALVLLADTFSKQVSSRDLSFTSTARAAYDALLGPVEARLTGVTDLVISPDGPLWRLPFQAMRTKRERFLIEERAVSYAPSISGLVALEERKRARATKAPFLVALGDPAFAAPIAARRAEEPSRAAPMRLPEAAREVRSAGQLYGSGRSTVLVDRAATEGALRQLSQRATILHIATHGILDDLNPMYSHLMLAPGSGRGTDDDGRLDAWELMDMGLSADLAILSACQTARGGIGYGEGLLGLSWSLFAAGASTAVVSQWEVDSASTTSLMIAFHQRLLKSRAAITDAPESLRQAAMTLMKNPAYRHPFYWAGFISVGAR